MIKRDFTKVLTSRILESNPLIQVVIGPRQVGKTTGIRQVIGQGGLYFSADSPVPIQAREIEDLWQKAQVETSPPCLVIDEVQKIPGWAEVIKKVWDSRTTATRLILSGSAALAIEKELKESLAGRFELIRVEHWNFAEAQAAFHLTLEQFIEFGCYPGAARFLNDLERWGDYIRDAIVEPAIGRDLLQLSPVEYPALLRQLFSVCIGHPAQLISLQKIQGQLQDRRAIATLQNYLQLFSYGFLVTGIQKYSTSLIRQKQSSPKLIIHDNALVRAFARPLGSPIASSRLGFYLENAVGARFLEAGWETYYWKERDWEVDFVVLGPGGERWAVEVKLSPPTQAEIRGLAQFVKRNSDFIPVVVCPEPVNLPGVRYLPASEMLAFRK